MTEDKIYTFSIYTENVVGLLNRVSNIFLKRHLNIESITASQSEIAGVNRFLIVAKTNANLAKKLVQQLEKQVEVIKAFYHLNEELIYEESALYKIKSKLLFEERQIQNIIKNSHARIVTVTPDFFVIEKTGRRRDTQALYEELKPFGIMQFVRSGRIAVSKQPMEVSELLRLNGEKQREIKK